MPATADPSCCCDSEGGSAMAGNKGLRHMTAFVKELLQEDKQRDFLRRGLEAVIAVLMETEVSELVGAERPRAARRGSASRRSGCRSGRARPQAQGVAPVERVDRVSQAADGPDEAAVQGRRPRPRSAVRGDGRGSHSACVLWVRVVRRSSRSARSTTSTRCASCASARRSWRSRSTSGSCMRTS